MNVENVIKSRAMELQADGSKVYVVPDIPEKKLNGAISGIAPGTNSDYVIAVIDTSLLGTGKTGAVILGDRIRFNNANEILTIFYKNVSSVSISGNPEEKNGATINIVYKDGTVQDITKVLSYMNVEAFMRLMNELAQEDCEDYESTNQMCPLSMMSPDIKETYIKLICNYAYSDDEVIDSDEYSEIMMLIVINEIQSDIRLKLRAYMTDKSSMQSYEELIQYIKTNGEQGSVDNLLLSVMKDVLNLFWKKKHNDDWMSDTEIIKIKRLLGIDDDQIKYILENIIENEKILVDRKSDIEIKKTMQELASKSAAVGVPLAAVYLSGSVIGVSAAGMTSGLAALGMGGVLGFSSMFTGIGVAVLLGVGAYQGVKKVTGMGDLEKNKQRELMLQQIAKNSQRALNYLVEDVNSLTAMLQKEIYRGQEADVKIKKLSAVLAMMTDGANKTVKTIDYTQKEQVLCSLPKQIDMGRIEELCPGATKKNIRDFINDCYSATEKNADGINIYHCINQELSGDVLEKLYGVLTDIGYYKMMDASLATAKSTAKNLIKGIMS